MHLLRRTMPTPVMPPGAPPRPESYSIVTLLEKGGVKVFPIWTFVPILGGDLSALQADVETWPKPSLALIKDTVLGVAPFTFYYPRGSGRTMRPGPNGPVVTDLGEAIGGVMQEQVDALLYVGPKSEITYASHPSRICVDRPDRSRLASPNTFVETCVELKTDRLTLRQARQSDLVEANAFMAHAGAMRYWSTPPHSDIEQTRSWLQAMIDASPQVSADFVIEFEGRVIGEVGAFPLPQFGFILHPDYWRRGFGFEAASAAIGHIFQTRAVESLVADVDPRNGDSIALLDGSW